MRIFSFCLLLIIFLQQNLQAAPAQRKVAATSGASVLQLQKIFNKFLSCKNETSLKQIRRVIESTLCFNQFFHPSVSQDDRATIEEWIYNTEFAKIRPCNSEESEKASFFHSYTPLFICFTAATKSETGDYFVFFKEQDSLPLIYTFFRAAPF